MHGITSDQIAELTHFLPRFEQPGRTFIEWRGGEKGSDGTRTLPYPTYPTDVTEFFRVAGQSWWCDYNYEPATAAAMLDDATVMATASIDQIKTMLTYCVRGERFADGHWGEMLASGRITALLKRLVMLQSG